MIVILDANVWLSETGLRSSLGAVARLYLQQTRARLGLPEVVRLEVEHHLRNRLREYVSTLESTHRQLLTIFGKLRELVLPDAMAIEGRVSELFENLGIEVLEIPFSLTSARSSFLKTVDKVPPSDRTQEFKDGVIWADCVAHLADDDVCLVTADKAFYRDRDYDKGLAPNLLGEIAQAKYKFTLLPSLDQLVGDLRVDVAIDERVLTTTYLADGFGAIEGLLQRNGYALGEQVGISRVLYATEDPSILYVEFAIQFDARPTISDGRLDGVVTALGDGSYDVRSQTLTKLRRLEESLRFKNAEGEDRELRNVYASLEAFLGHKEVSHTIRRKLS